MRAVLSAAALGLLRGGPDVVRFDYGTHGQDWVGGQCGSRARQSPIDLHGPELSVVPMDELYVKYMQTDEYMLVNNGYTIHVDLENQGLGGITLDNAWFNLLTVNIHAKGEHTYSGARPDLELHLVHKRYDDTSLAVIAIPFEADGEYDAVRAEAEAGEYKKPDPSLPGHSQYLELFTEMPLPEKDQTVGAYMPWDISGLVAGNYVAYDGSLTAPPCSENVKWFVRQEPLKASTEQVEKIVQAMYRTNPQGNWRTTLPLGERKLQVVKTVEGEPALTADPRVAAVDQKNLQEQAAMSWGRDAARQAMTHLSEVKELDQRLRRAATAHAQGLQPNPLAGSPTDKAYTGAAGAQDGPAGPLYVPGEVANSMSKTLGKAVDEAVDTLKARIHPGAAARQHAQDLSAHLNNGQLVGQWYVDQALAAVNGAPAAPAAPAAAAPPAL